MSLIAKMMKKRGVPKGYRISPEDMARSFVSLQVAFDNLTLGDIPTYDAAYQTVSQQDRESWNSPYKASGQAALTEGEASISADGLLATDLAFDGLASINGGNISATARILLTCTENTLTITAIKSDGTTNVNDTSLINYFVIPNPNPVNNT